jgi:hypothetical protein
MLTVLGVLGTAAFASAPLPAAESRLPVELRAPPVLLPLGASGEVPPEIQVRLTVDPRGLVSTVDVLEITPSSGDDELYREAVVSALREWRYAPRLENGVAVESELSWTIQSQRSQQAWARGSLPPAGAYLGGDVSEVLRSRALKMPDHQRRERLDEIARLAWDALFSDRRQRYGGGRFLVLTDAEDPRTAEILANNGEAVFNTLDRWLGAEIELQPLEYRIVLVAFSEPGSLAAFMRQAGHAGHLGAAYFPQGLIALDLGGSSDDVMATLIHELAHAHVDRRVQRPGLYLPSWLSEGFAEYVGNSRVRNGELMAGRTLRRKYGMEMGSVVKVTTDAGLDLAAARSAVRSGRAPSLQQMLTAGPDVFYGQHARLYYPVSWLLVHYLVGGAGAGPELFPRFLLYVAEGYSPAESFEHVFGRHPTELETDYRTYVQKF